MVAEKIAEEWYVPLTETKLTLREALQGMAEFKLEQNDVPLIIQLIENPKYNMLGIFPGRTSIQAHDCIHVLLGRGVLVKDEAFVIGFTMGSSRRMTTFREKLFLFCSRYLYPEGYRFNDDDAKVFKNGVRLSHIHRCEDLAQIDYEQYLDLPLETVREKIGLDSNLIRAYYKLEKRTYPEVEECQRLI
ncbi:hypothetical protein H8E06_01270 [bacterium]|nr:hypothetical protein [bacterium]